MERGGGVEDWNWHAALVNICWNNAIVPKKEFQQVLGKWSNQLISFVLSWEKGSLIVGSLWVSQVLCQCHT